MIRTQILTSNKLYSMLLCYFISNEYPKYDNDIRFVVEDKLNFNDLFEQYINKDTNNNLQADSLYKSEIFIIDIDIMKTMSQSFQFSVVKDKYLLDDKLLFVFLTDDKVNLKKCPFDNDLINVLFVNTDFYDFNISSNDIRSDIHKSCKKYMDFIIDKIREYFDLKDTLNIKSSENTISNNILTSRERQILKLVASGMLNKEISKSLNISEQTVKNHLFNIYRKINVDDRTQAAIYAINHDL